MIDLPQLDIIRLEQAAQQVNLIYPDAKTPEGRLFADFQRTVKNQIIEMIGIARQRQGRKGFDCFSRQYGRDGWHDDDDCEEFETYAEAQAWARKEKTGRGGVRVWINNVEI